MVAPFLSLLRLSLHIGLGLLVLQVDRRRRLSDHKRLRDLGGIQKDRNRVFSQEAVGVSNGVLSQIRTGLLQLCQLLLEKGVNVRLGVRANQLRIQSRVVLVKRFNCKLKVRLFV